MAESNKELEQYSKESFFEELREIRPDILYPEVWSDQQRAEVAELVKPQSVRKTLFSIIPMRCRGPECQFAEACPLQQKGIAPVGSPCPIEAALTQELMQEYMYELGVEPSNMIEVGMVRDLVNQEIQQNRASWLLSLENFIQENVVGVSAEGQIVKQKQLHLAVELEDKVLKRKKDIRNQLLATREARAKAGKGNLDTAQAISNLLAEVRSLERTKEKELLAKAGITDDYDAYIDVEEVDGDQ